MTSVVASIPLYDPATEWGYPYIRQVAEEAQRLGYYVKICEKDSATPQCVYSALADPNVKNDVGAFVGVGHGDADVFTGQNSVPIFKTCQQPPETFSGQKAYLMYSCITARGLGPDFVQKGAKAYWGWDDYALVGRPGTKYEKLQTVLRDAWIMFLRGSTIGEAYNWARQQWYQIAEQCRQQGDLQCYSAFKWQADHCKLLGDPNFKLRRIIAFGPTTWLFFIGLFAIGLVFAIIHWTRKKK